MIKRKKLLSRCPQFFSDKFSIVPFSFLMIAVFYLLIGNDICLASEWKLCNPALTGSQLYDVLFISPDEGFAVGGNGVIVHTIDSGRTWQLQSTPTDYPGFLLSIAFCGKDTGFAVGGVFGRTFALMTVDRGKKWIDVSNRFPQGGLRTIHINNGDIWVTHWNRTPNISVSHDQGNSWTSDTIGDGSSLGDVQFINDSIGIVCGDKGYRGKTIDCGKSWLIATDTIKGVYKQLAIVGCNVYALGLNGQLTVSKDTGNTWSLFVNYMGKQFHELYFTENRNSLIDDGFIIAGNNPINVIRFKDILPSNSPTNATLPIYSEITSVTSLTKNRSIGVCLNGAIFELSGLADSCKEITSNTGGSITALDFRDSLNGVCGTEMGEVFISSDAGVTWNKSFLPEKSSVVSITAFSDGMVLALTAGNNFNSNDFGRSWTQINDPQSPLNIGQNSLVPHKTIFKEETYSRSAHTVKGDTLFFTSNAGKSWQKRGVIVFDQLDPVKERNEIWAISFPNSSNGWAVTVSGAISHSKDSGKTWVAVANIPSIRAEDVYFTDVLHGWVGGKKSGNSPYQPVIFMTRDGGLSWEEAKGIAFDSVLDRHTDLPFSAEILKIRGRSCSSLWTLSNEGVLFSSDTGKTWRQQMLPQYGNVFYDLFIGMNGDAFVAGDNSRIWKGFYRNTESVKPHQQSIKTSSLRNKFSNGNVFNIGGRKVGVNKIAGSGLLRGKATGTYFVKGQDVQNTTKVINVEK
jgi:photosystem II stability/assembly factor-like uncharacterized protein